MVSRIGFLAAALACALVSGCATGGNGNTGGSSSTTSNPGGGDSGPPAECGNGTVETGEACDDGNLFPTDGCSGTCTVEPGFACTGSPSICSPVCGDGFTGGEEECDDKNTTDGDGCSAACKVEAGYQCKGSPSKCTTTCGDGLVGGSEECDDNNVKSGDGCSLSCKLEEGYKCTGQPSTCVTVCGDGNINGAEECDDGDATDGDGCSSTCTLEAGYTCTGEPSLCLSVCNDGIIASDEECDDTNNADGDGCNATCMLEQGWNCLGQPSICTPICGDGLIRGAEECDDQNLAGADGCNGICKIGYGYTCVGEPSKCSIVCGDGVIAGTEICDDGNSTSGDGCSSLCKVEAGFTCTGMPSKCTAVCGNGVITQGEACDDGNLVPNDGCSPTCTIDPGYKCVGSPSYCTTNCGDGVLGGGEQCDDGNTVSGDGCSFGCTIEGGFNCNTASPTVCTGICGDGLIVGKEQCDDGNTVAGDCCVNCQAEPGCEHELNNSSQTANDVASIGISGKVKGIIFPTSDVDYYSVTIPAGAASGTVAIAVQDGPVSGDTCASNKIETLVTVYDPNGVELVSDKGSGPGNCSLLTAPALPPGTYYIAVQNAPTSSKTYSYSLQVTTTLSVCGNGAKEPGEQCDDNNTVSGDGCSSVCTIEGLPSEVEPNNDFAAADARAADPSPILFTGPTLLAGSIPVAGDKDIFKMQLAVSGVVRLETFDNINPGSCSITATRIRLFNAAKQLIYTDANSGIANCSALVVNLAAGTYYVQVEGAQLATTVTGYFIEVAFPTNGGNETEPNATIAQATPVPGAETYVFGGHQTNSDVDFYAITVPAGASIRAEIIEGGAETCEGFDVDSQITLYDAAGSVLTSDDDNGRGYCSLLDGTGNTPANPPAHNLTAGTYYLAVRATTTAAAGGSAGQFDYRLVVTVR